MFRSSRCGVAIATTLLTLLTGCAPAETNNGSKAQPTLSSLSVPDQPEDVTLTAPVRRVLGPHAVEVGDPPTLVIVVDGVPPSLRPGAEAVATGTVRVFQEQLGAELGIPLSATSLKQFHGAECLVVSRLAVLE
ncbi:MAG TPA: hypothetical protein VGR26_18360 [Acidimicrobiales bacterium]|nr:hypothetical protein [Acidimicrobiales bacterium]